MIAPPTITINMEWLEGLTRSPSDWIEKNRVVTYLSDAVTVTLGYCQPKYVVANRIGISPVFVVV